jgi:hypothetical protein
MATKVKKLKKAELETIRQAVNVVNALTNQLGQMEIAKANTLAQVKQAQENVQEEQKKLEEIYGSVTIDLNTGEITKTDEEVAE